MTFTIRPSLHPDLGDLKDVIDSTGLFPGEMLEGMMADYFAATGSADLWLTACVDERPVAVAYCAPERLTEGTFNLYLIAVHGNFQGKGIGRSIMAEVETLLASQGVRILLVETSGLPDFERTRRFYDGCSYEREAVIRDFYRDGEDKVIFRKRLR